MTLFASVTNRKLICLLLAAILILSLTGCSGSSGQSGMPAASSENAEENSDMSVLPEEREQTLNGSSEIPEARRDIFAMDTYMTVACYGERCEEAADAAEAEIERLDELLSVGNPSSEISLINKNGYGTLSDDSKIMVEESLKIYEDTDGAFDITVYPLMVLWGFTNEEYNVPGEDELAQTLSLTGSDRLKLEGDILTLEEGQGIDLGGIAKGYASDRLMEIFKEYSLQSGLISLGGNVDLYGYKPDGSLWRCGIQDPFAADGGTTLMGVLEAHDCAIITSGAYERYFKTEDGQTYHHILDPHTGYPAYNGLVSVSIVTPFGLLADGLSTACYVMGLEGSIEYWADSEEDFDMILMTEDEKVYITEGLEGYFSTDYDMTVIYE